MEKQAKRAHALIVPYPAQGHLNPMLQFGKRLASKGVKSTLVTTVFVSKTMHLDPGSVQVDTISDGFDETGIFGAESIEAYLDSFQTVGSKTLSELIGRHSTTANPITCVVYDSMMPWILDVTKDHGLLGVSFFTMPCAVNNIVYYVYHGLLPLPLSSTLVSVPGLPLLGIEDMPSFLSVPGLYPAYLQSSLDQYSNVDKADFMLVNTIYELEDKVVDSISTQYPILTIGPTIPSVYLDNRMEDDKFYGLSLFNPDYAITTNWLKDKPPSSVVYVSFGSVCSLGEDQIMELAWALKASNCYYMWVIRASLQAKLPKTIFNEIGEKGIIVKWSPQLEVLANKAVGCFLTHCGWNSTLEGLCLGVPMIAMPQWADQMTNAKLIQDVWKVGIRVKFDHERGIVTGQEIMNCLIEVMCGGSAEEMRANAKRISHLAKEAISEGGSSDKNINKFVSDLEKFVAKKTCIL